MHYLHREEKSLLCRRDSLLYKMKLVTLVFKPEMKWKENNHQQQYTKNHFPLRISEENEMDICIFVCFLMFVVK